MSIGNWTIISGSISGDISYSLRKSLVTSVYAELELTAFGEKWQEFDVGFEYRPDDKNDWRDDALIIETSAKYLDGNKLYGLTASKYGEVNTLKWKYSQNNLLYGTVPQIRFVLLPRLRMFGSANNQHSVTYLYGKNIVDLDGISRHNCIGMDNDGNYMCLGSHSFYIIDDLDAEEESTSSESSSSSSSFCCVSPTCISGDCAWLNTWNLSGMNESNSDNCTLYVTYREDTTDIVEIYKDVAKTQMVASGSAPVADLPGTITLTQQNSSGLSGTVLASPLPFGSKNLIIQC